MAWGRQTQDTAVSGEAESHAARAREILAGQKVPGLTLGNPLEVAQARFSAASAHATLALYELLKQQERPA